MKDKILVMQDDSKDCGISSLLSIIRYYGGNVSKEYLRELTKTTKDGVSAYYLIQAGRELGFNSFGISGDIKTMNNVIPIINFVANFILYHHLQNFHQLYLALAVVLLILQIFF